MSFTDDLESFRRFSEGIDLFDEKRYEEALVALRRLKRRCPNASFELWAQDEARIGLVPNLWRVWSRRGQRPIAAGRRTYE